MSLSSVFVKVVLIGVISWNLTPLPIFLSDSNIDKRRVPFSVLSAQEPVDKKGYPFSSFANKCNRSLMLALSSSLICGGSFICRKLVFINQFLAFQTDLISKKGYKIKASPFGDKPWKRAPFFQKKGKAFLNFLKITYNKEWDMTI